MQNLQSGNKQFLTIIDHLSGWPEAFTIPDKSADTIVSTFINQYLPVIFLDIYCLTMAWSSRTIYGPSTEWWGMKWIFPCHIILRAIKNWKFSINTWNQPCRSYVRRTHQIGISTSIRFLPVQNDTKPCHGRNTFLPSLWKRPQFTFTPGFRAHAMILRRSKLWTTPPWSSLTCLSHC